jgi:hypothetical protein
VNVIDNWRQAPRMYVVQVLATIAIVQGVWAELPPELIAQLPPNLVHWVTVALSLAGIVVRVIKQFHPPDFPDTKPLKDQP